MGKMGVSMSRAGHGNWVELRVQENGEDTLVYQFPTIAEAVEILEFIREFFPGAKFVLEPLRH